MEKLTLEQLNRGYFDLMDKSYSKGIKNPTAFWLYMATRRLNYAAEKQENIYEMHQELKARLKIERKNKKAQQQAEISVGR